MFVEKVVTFVGNPIFLIEINLIHYVIILKILNLPEILDEMPNFYGILTI
jgi:hypothetical protein